MKIKLTQRGRFVVSSLLAVGVFLSIGFCVYIVGLVATADYDSIGKRAHIQCVEDTVLQPDGSCLEKEK